MTDEEKNVNAEKMIEEMCGGEKIRTGIFSSYKGSELEAYGLPESFTRAKKS